MSPAPGPPAARTALDATRGRTDGPEALRRLLVSAPPDYLEGALANPALGDEEVARMLRNPRAGRALLDRVARVPRWTRNPEVKAGLVRHPRTALALARRFLGHLRWTDLAETAGDLRLSPVLRRQAEDLIEVRLGEMTEGERIALARRARDGVIAALAARPEPRVLRALLSNSRTPEREAVRIAAAPETPAETLEYLARHPAWSIRPAVRRALLTHPRTPVPAALRLLARAPRAELQRLDGDASAPPIVRLGAARRLAGLEEDCG